MTTFSGPNGEGKTNLVEAIGYLATLGSHRVATDAPLVRQGADRAILRAAVTGAQGSALVEIEVNPGRANRVRLNRAPMPRPRDILGVLRTVLFAPEDLALVKGDPGERRRFLDDLLVATAPRYAGVRADYERVLRQRTALLKSAGAKGHLRGAAREAMTATLDAWDAQLARAGAPLLAGRLPLVAALRPHVTAAYEAVSGGPAGEAGNDLPQFALENSDEFDDVPVRWRRPCSRRCPRPGPASWSAASAWSARTGTSWSCPSAGCPPAATPATGSPGRSPWRSGWPPSSCCARTARTRC